MIMESKLLIDISKLNNDGAFKAVVQIIYLKQKYDSRPSLLESGNIFSWNQKLSGIVIPDEVLDDDGIDTLKILLLGAENKVLLGGAELPLRKLCP
jgi:hypothetical protein